MGIRFACHECNKRLNIKRELAGKRGVCPDCSARFRIPLEDSETSTPIEPKEGGVERANQTVESGNGVGRALQSESRPNDFAKSPSSQDLLVGDPTSTWYVRPPTGGQYGPASPDVLLSWVDEGRVAATSLIWRDGWPQWRVASDVLPDLIQPKSPPSRSPESIRPPAASMPLEPGGIEAADAVSAVSLEGSPDVGVQRRAKSGHRILMIGVLMAVAITLIVALVIILNRGQTVS